VGLLGGTVYRRRRSRLGARHPYLGDLGCARVASGHVPRGPRQHDAFGGYFPLQNLKKPMPVHTSFENQVAFRPSSHQRAEILRAGVIDATSLQVAPLRIEHAIDAVCLVIIDTDERRHPCWLNWLPFHGDNLRVHAPCRATLPADQATISLSCRLIIVIWCAGRSARNKE
jgi:hypothetical protein